MAVTIKDVAALAGVSPSTVSRTCKDNPSISNETKEKVRRAMAELGYEAGIQATSSQDSKIICIILPPSPRAVYDNPFYLEAIRGISQFCNRHQYISTVITGQNEEELLDAINTMIKNGHADGFIVLYSRENDRIIDYLYNEGFLYVLIGKAHQFANQTIYVDNDNALAGQDAAEYLYHLGHRKIAYLGRPDNMLFSSDRKAGYQLTLLKHDLPVRPEYYVEAESFSIDDDQNIRNLLEMEDRPTAIIVCDDILALSLERLCLRCGLSIPEDLSIISFNNSLFARLTSPELTSVDINTFQLGIEAASQIINHIENPNLMATKIIVPHSLVEPDSCRKI